MRTILNAKNGSGKKNVPIKWQDRTWSARIIIRSIVARAPCQDARFLASAHRRFGCGLEAKTAARSRGPAASRLAVPVQLLNSRFSHFSASDNSF